MPRRRAARRGRCTMPIGLRPSATIRTVTAGLGRIDGVEHLGGEHVAAQWSSGIFRHDVIDPGRHQVGPHVTAQIAVGDDAGDIAVTVDDADAAETLRRHLDQRVRHPGAERLGRDGLAGVHDVADEFQHGAELAAGMEVGEFHRGKAAALQQRDRQRVAQRQQHQRGGGGREIVRTGLARLRQRQRDDGGLAQGGLAIPPSWRSARSGTAWHR